MEPLLDHLAVMHKAPSMPHDRAERVDMTSSIQRRPAP
jgi:hypothetical protein